LEVALVWLLIIALLLVAFGPILWLRPSPRDRRLAALRAEGRKQGLRIEMRRYPKLDLLPEERVTAGGKPIESLLEAAVYLQPLDPKLRHLPPWRILRGAEGLPARPGWVFELGRRPEHPALRAVLDALEPLLATLPADVEALECDPLHLGAYWLERPGNDVAAVVALAAWLREAAGRLTELERALAEQEL
jgi:hypothetical protein